MSDLGNMRETADKLLTLKAMLAAWEKVKGSNPDDAEALVYGALDLAREMVGE